MLTSHLLLQSSEGERNVYHLLWDIILVADSIDRGEKVIIDLCSLEIYKTSVKTYKVLPEDHWIREEFAKCNLEKALEIIKDYVEN